MEFACLRVTREKWLSACGKMVSIGRCLAFDNGNVPQAVFGVDASQRSWFQAIDGVELIGLTRHMRRLIPTLDWGIYETHSLCISHDAPKWFSLLGGVEDVSFRGPVRDGFRERKFIGGT